MRLLAGALLSLALAVPQSVPSPVPVDREPYHHVKYENKYVRVIDAVVPAGKATLFHTHDRDNVPVAISGGKTTVEPLGRPAVDWPVTTGSVSFAGAVYTHKITNVDRSDIRFIDAEVLSSPGRAPASSSLEGAPFHSRVFENDRVRVYRVVLEPGQSTGPHLHNTPGLDVTVTGGRVEVGSEGSRLKADRARAGAFSWHQEPFTHTIRNTGTSRFEEVDIEWK